MASDALLTLATANTTINNTTAPSAPNWVGTNSQTVLDLKTLIGTRRSNPLTAYILYSAGSTSAGNGSALFTVDHSDDNTNWYVLHAADQGAITFSNTVTAAGQTFVTIGRSKRYVRLNAFLAGTNAQITIGQAVVRISEP